MVNLLEEVALLAYRDDKGRNAVPYLQWSLAGAALLELALGGHIVVDDTGRVAVREPGPVARPGVDEALKRLSESRTRHIPSSWVQILAGVDLRLPVLEGLVEQRILTHDREKVLGLIPVNRYRPVETGVEEEVRARLERAFDHAAGADVRTAALAGIISATFMEGAALPQHEYGAVNKTFRELAAGFVEIEKFVEGVQLAVTLFRSTPGSATAVATS
ncbi:GPP34 family phosphoprotein [Phytomonospora sp. NPDC050363]|uniref:GOLPH3/VPS74 family protein n=1 Tax=Phytomonospora sp. NPDC050363 TaxID=3155642 RepID=UPI0033F3CACC